LNTKKLIEAQKILDERIFLKHIPENAEQYHKRKIQRIVANIVELAEFINETRIFKFWSNKEPEREKILEEYADGVHFFLGNAIERGWEESIHYIAEGIKENTNKIESIERTYLEINYYLSAIEVQKATHPKYFEIAWLLYLSLGMNAFGFTGEEIEAAYFAKNQINHDRQASGY